MIPKAKDLLASLQQNRIIEPDQLDMLGHEFGSKNREARVLAQKLIELGLLTPFQVNLLLNGQGEFLIQGSYLLLERLGEGGAGQVFKARHRKMKRLAALKLIRKELLDDPEAVGRFYREIQLVAKLDHPNVVQAFDAGPSGSTHFLATEYVEGIDLGRLIKKNGPLPVEQARAFLHQAASGLAHIHEKHLVHRDIKPHNLLLGTRDNVIKIADLGLARLQRSVNDELTQILTGATATGTLTPENPVLIGTADYLAPEQAIDFHRADIRSDLYSLGCTFYYLLSGRPPFAGGTLAQKLLRHQQAEPPALVQSRPDIPEPVDAILRKLLAKDPGHRFQSPAELVATLASPAKIALPQEPSGRRKPKRKLGLVLAGGTLILVALVWMTLLSLGPHAGSGKPNDPDLPRPASAIVNSIGMKLNFVPAGEFIMGSPASEADREANEGPAHTVKISRGFYLGVNEVKQGEFDKVLGESISRFRLSTDHPVERVTWDEAMAFCQKLSALPEEQVAGRVYRLPTEAEWEYACRAGTTTPFHSGDRLSLQQAHFTMPSQAATETSVCGRFPANAWGLHDMHGNVWEWCLDGPRSYAPDTVQDPRGNQSGTHMLRGGAWDVPASSCRSAKRNPVPASRRLGSIGFRVLLEQ